MDVFLRFEGQAVAENGRVCTKGFKTLQTPSVEVAVGAHDVRRSGRKWEGEWGWEMGWSGRPGGDWVGWHVPAAAFGCSVDSVLSRR